MAWPRDNSTLDVVVDPENIERAMCIAQAIADALEERGGELSAKPGEDPADGTTQNLLRSVGVCVH